MRAARTYASEILEVCNEVPHVVSPTAVGEEKGRALLGPCVPARDVPDFALVAGDVLEAVVREHEVAIVEETQMDQIVGVVAHDLAEDLHSLRSRDGGIELVDHRVELGRHIPSVITADEAVLRKGRKAAP